MKHKTLLLFFGIFFSFLLMSSVKAQTCTYTYIYSEIKAGMSQTYKDAKGGKIELSMPSMQGKVTTKGTGNFNFGDSKILSNWTSNTCPRFIVTHAKDGNWYGYDERPDLKKYEINGYLPDDGLHVFIDDSKPIETYTCSYGESNYSIIHSKEGYALWADDLSSGLHQTGHSNYMYYLYLFEFSDSLKNALPINPGTCENTYVCGTLLNAGSIFTSTTILKMTIYSDAVEAEANCKGNSVQEYKSEEAGDNAQCRTFPTYLSELSNKLNSCDPTKSLNFCQPYSNYKNKLKSYCSNITSYIDYGDACLEYCLGLNEEIATLENDHSEKNTNECGFSDRLISFIINISKWVRYIVPVAVIILGIIDFLRALSTDKDDGLKKAQGRFIRRVIAAALIFIIPFILEFIIEKMGFISDTCGII